jgi:hypothetical protein
VKDAHGDEERRHERCERAAKAVDRALLRLDESLGASPTCACAVEAGVS